jgi:hypothetical protein
MVSPRTPIVASVSCEEMRKWSRQARMFAANGTADKGMCEGSSVVERLFVEQEVEGSIPSPRTNLHTLDNAYTNCAEVAQG